MNSAIALVLATSIMALGAITFSALSLAFQRSHSRKSVRPFCNVIQRVSESEIRVSIQNAGMGPMRLEKLVLLANEGDSISDGIPLAEAFSNKCKTNTLLHHAEDYVLAPSLEVELFHCALQPSGDAGAIQWSGKPQGGYLGIAYTDIYDHLYEKIESLGAN